MTPQVAANAQTTATTEAALAYCQGGREKLLGGAETILFVEDEAFVRRVTEEVLCAAGYRVLTAKDATTAATACDLHCGDVDLLLTDVILPGENGRVLARRLKEARPGLKILLITGYADQMGLQNADPGAWLAKPFSVGVLLQKARQVLERE